MRVVFMGTPKFVIPVLDSLAQATEVELIGVYTPPDRPRGRGRSPEMPPVKEHALTLGLPVFQPTTLRSAQVQQQMAGLCPEVIVVAAYGRFLPEPVSGLPRHGCLNLHPSMLPKYRGPSPVVTAIREGEPITGVTLMKLDQGMDTGPLIAQRKLPIAADDTGETLTDALFKLGAELLMEKLFAWVKGELTAQPQDNTQATVTSKLERSDGRADWALPAATLERLRRAYTPRPGLFTHWQDQVLKLLDVVPLPESDHSGKEPGTVVQTNTAETPLGVVTSDGVLGLKWLQLEGRRSSSADEFQRGYPQFVGTRL